MDPVSAALPQNLRRIFVATLIWVAPASVAASHSEDWTLVRHWWPLTRRQHRVSVSSSLTARDNFLLCRSQLTSKNVSSGQDTCHHVSMQPLDATNSAYFRYLLVVIMSSLVSISRCMNNNKCFLTTIISFEQRIFLLILITNSDCNYVEPLFNCTAIIESIEENWC